MIITIKKESTKEEVEKQLAKLKSKKEKKKKSLWNVFGQCTIEGDALEIQKKMRDEWD